MIKRFHILYVLSSQNAVDKVDEPLQPLLFQAQQRPVIFQRLGLVKGGVRKDFPDFFQRKIQLSEKENLPQTGEGRVVIQPVSRLGGFGRGKQSDFIIICLLYTSRCV